MVDEEEWGAVKRDEEWGWVGDEAMRKDGVKKRVMGRALGAREGGTLPSLKLNGLLPDLSNTLPANGQAT